MMGFRIIVKTSQRENIKHNKTRGGGGGGGGVNNNHVKHVDIWGGEGGEVLKTCDFVVV